MRTKGFIFSCVFWCLMGANTALAEDMPQEVEPLPNGGVYRFMGESGDLVHTRTLPWEGIVAGYEVLDSSGRVVKSIPALPTEEEKAERERRKAEILAKKEQEERDRELLRMYATPRDAERALERQLAAIEMSINYSRNAKMQAEVKRDNAIQQAADRERRGQEVPEHLAESIERYQREVDTLKKEIEAQEKDKQAVQEDYAPIISRLKDIVR